MVQVATLAVVPDGSDDCHVSIEPIKFVSARNPEEGSGRGVDQELIGHARASP